MDRSTFRRRRDRARRSGVSSRNSVETARAAALRAAPRSACPADILPAPRCQHENTFRSTRRSHECAPRPGMSPAFTLPSSECTSTPSQTSIAILARYSCERCIGLRVWNAATRDHPSRSNSLRVSAGVMNSSPYFALKPPSESTCTGPARFTSPWSMTILTPGCSISAVRNTDRHSCVLSIGYFSETYITASTSVSSPASAISSPTRMESAVFGSTENVIGIGQKTPSAVRKLVADTLPVGARHEAL